MGETIQRKYSRAIDRKLARPGFILGTAVSLLVAFFYLLGFTRRFELVGLDIAYKVRSPNPASDQLLLVEIDDNADRRFARKRGIWADAMYAIQHLGAKWVGLDITFDARGEIDAVTGAWTADAATERLAKAMALGGRAVIGFRCEEDFQWSAKARIVDKLQKVVLAAPDIESEDALRAAGLTTAERALVGIEFEYYRDMVLWLSVCHAMAEQPTLSYPELVRRLLPGLEAQPGAYRNELYYLSRNFAAWTSWSLMQSKDVALKIQRDLSPMPSYPRLLALNQVLLSHAADVGCTNTPSQDGDGILRKAPFIVRIGGEPYLPAKPSLYLGLKLALRSLEDERGRVEVALGPQFMEIRIVDRTTGAIRETRRIPVGPNGTTLANWTGKPAPWGRRGPADYAHLSLGSLVEHYQRIRVTRLKFLSRFAEGFTTGLFKIAEDNIEAIDETTYPDPSPLYAVFPAKVAAWSKAFEDPAVPVDDFRRMDAELERDVAAMEAAVLQHIGRRREWCQKLPPRTRDPQVAAANAYEEQLHKGKDIEKVLKSRVEGKTVIIGTTANQGGDLHTTPVGPGQPGVDLQMTAANEVLTGRSLRSAPMWIVALLTMLYGTSVAWFVTNRSTIPSSVFTGILSIGICVLFIGAFDRAGLVIDAGGPLLAVISSYAASMFFRQFVTLRSQKQLQRELETKMSPNVVTHYMENPDFFSRPRKVVATAYFSDIKGFTTISENMDAEELVGFINRYHDSMTRILLAHEAYIDKYIGDGIMALFGAPIEDERHALRACSAALRNLQAVDDLNVLFAKEGLPRISIRVGIHSGEIVVAKVGSRDRADLTAMGDSVNLAARLEGANKAYGTSIMMSEKTYEFVQGQFNVRELDTIRVVGKNKAVKVYELLGQSGQPTRLESEFLSFYQRGLDAFKRRKWSEAEDLFANARMIVPDDLPSKIYIDRCATYRLKNPGPLWEPVYDLESK